MTTEMREPSVKGPGRPRKNSTNGAEGGPALKRAMKEAGWTNGQLAAHLGRNGQPASDRLVTAWRSGADGPDEDTARLIDRAFDAHGRLYDLWWPEKPTEPAPSEAEPSEDGDHGVARSRLPDADGPARRGGAADVEVDQARSRREPAEEQVGRRRWPLVAVLATATILLAVLLGLSGVLGGAAGRAEAISGSVTCEDGSTVVGVYVVASDGGSGFAHTLGAGSSKHFSTVLPHGGPWKLNAGCGGSPAQWLHRPLGLTTTTAAEASWTCVTSDMAGGEEYCRPS